MSLLPGWKYVERYIKKNEPDWSKNSSMPLVPIEFLPLDLLGGLFTCFRKGKKKGVGYRQTLLKVKTEILKTIKVAIVLWLYMVVLLAVGVMLLGIILYLLI